MFIVYVIENSNTKKFYTGQTENLDKRLEYHNGLKKSKVTSYTRKNSGKGKWNVVYSESYSTREQALKREKELKSSRGRNFIKSITAHSSAGRAVAS